MTTESRYRYALTPESVVIDAGGYQGEFADEIYRRYGCYVHVFEPWLEHWRNISAKFLGVGKIRVHNFGIGGHDRHEEFRWKGSMTGSFADGTDCAMVKIRDAASVVDELGGDIALAKINIENMEYEVLERLLESGRVNNVDRLQIQFHSQAPDYEARYRAIRSGLLKTHDITWESPFVWENYERRT